MSTANTSKQSSLASQIHQATSKHFELVAIDQPNKVIYCDGPDSVVCYFLHCLSAYPPSVFRLPFSVVLLEIQGLQNQTGARKRKAKKLMKSLSSVVRRAVGPGDLVVRSAFNQFSLLLLGHDEVSAGKVCERIKHAIRHYLYFQPEQQPHLELGFAIAQHLPCESDCDDLADLVFSNERTMRLARALGDGAIVCRSEAKDRFQSHRALSYHLGESFDSTMLRLDENNSQNY